MVNITKTPKVGEEGWMYECNKSLDDIEQAFNNNSIIKVVFVTNPGTDAEETYIDRIGSITKGDCTALTGMTFVASAITGPGAYSVYPNQYAYLFNSEGIIEVQDFMRF